MSENQWRVSGEILMDNANTVLRESDALAMPSDLQIDFSAVTEVDTAALSLMMEWQRRATLLKTSVSFAHVPEALASLATLYGVAAFIPLAN